MSRGLLLVDGSNIGLAANASQPLKIGDQPTQAIFGVLRTLRPMVTTYSMLTPVVLWDAVSWRYGAFPDYKGTRHKEASKKYEIEQQRQRAEFKQQLPFIKEAIALLGIRQMSALNYEADDLAGLIIEKLEKSGKRGLMISADKDWVQLITPNVSWLDPIRDYRLTYKTISQKLGYAPERKKIVVDDGTKIADWVGVPSPRAWLEMKALMGDTSDNIPGVGGIGDRGAIDFVNQYGSVASFFNQCSDKSIDVDKLPKKLRDFATSDEKQELFRRNVRLMDLRTKERPDPVQLKTVHNELDADGFEKFCRRFMFNSILTDLDGWLEPFQSKMALAA